MKAAVPVFHRNVSRYNESDMLKLYVPKYEDLSFRKMMMEDEKTMSYNHAYGGCIPFPEENWRSWYESWILDTGGSRTYRYLQDEEESFVGEIAYHLDEKGRWMADLIIFSPYRGKGYGTKGLELLCLLAKENGIKTLYDEIAIDNPSVSLFVRNGFKEESRDEEKITVRKEL